MRHVYNVRPDQVTLIVGKLHALLASRRVFCKRLVSYVGLCNVQVGNMCFDVRSYMPLMLFLEMTLSGTKLYKL